MKITVSVTESSHQNRGQCFLHLYIFLYTHSPLFLENKKLPSLFSTANYTINHCSISISNPMFGKSIWDRLPECIFKNLKLHE